MRSNAKKILGFEDFNGHVEKWIDGFEDDEKDNLKITKKIIKRNLKIKMRKNEEKKTINRCEENRTEIDFVLVGRNDRKYLKEVKAMPGYLSMHL